MKKKNMNSINQNSQMKTKVSAMFKNKMTKKIFKNK